MDTNSSPAISCLIIDDEQAAHDSLTRLIQTVPWLNLQGHCYSAVEAAGMISALRPELIFLDVKMPGLSGLDLIALLPDPRPHIVLTTAFKDYAFDGFENEVSDFLLKPIKNTRFYRAVISVRETVLLKNSVLLALRKDQPNKANPQSTLAANQPPIVASDIIQQLDDTIWIYSGKKFHHLNLSELYAVVGLKDYVKVHHAGGTIVVKGSIGSIERKLPSPQFIRIHRSYIVNRSAIRMIEGNTVKMPGGYEFTIPSYKSKEHVINQLLDRQRRI